MLGDVLCLVLSLVLTIYFAYGKDLYLPHLQSHIKPFLVIYITWILILFLFNLYDYSYIKPTIGNIRNIAVAILVSFGVGLIFFYTFPIFGLAPKTNLLINSLIFGILFIGWRRIFFNFYSKNFQRDLIILGQNEKSKDLADELKSNPHIGYRFTGFTENFSTELNIKRSMTVVVAKDFNFDSNALHLVMNNDIEIMSLIEAYEKIFAKIPLELIDEVWLIQNIKNSRKSFYRFLKRVIDIFAGLIIFTLSIPFFIIIGLGIKFEDGRGVLYKQKRIGIYNNDFYLYKFQSMIENAERNGPEWSGIKDDRITAFGRILRKTHLDELPQIINVLRGDLSLVGPRPERPEFVKSLEKEIPYFDLRHIIKPGVTGWAQVKFKYARSILDSYQKFEYDMYYAKNQNIFMDLGIIFRTIQKLFS